MSKTFEHDGCVGCKYEKESETSSYCQGCKQNAVDKYRRMTNADRVRSMDDDELAAFLLKVNKTCSVNCTIFGGNCKWEDYPTHDKGCKDCFKEWLEREVEDERFD